MPRILHLEVHGGPPCAGPGWSGCRPAAWRRAHSAPD
jgi:hypothetical protein